MLVGLAVEDEANSVETSTFIALLAVL